MKRLGSLPALMVVLALLSGCASKKATNSTPIPTVPASAIASAAASPSAIALNPNSSLSITDGICVALLPENWTVTGNGRGFAPSGARYTLFGNTLTGDADWTEAVSLAATAAAGEQAAVEKTSDSITIEREDGTYFEARRRLSDRYCDFSAASSAPAPAGERATWPRIGASMHPAPAGA